MPKTAQQLLFADHDAEAQAALPWVDYDRPKSKDAFCGIALIGEAPGADEVRLRHPFVGRSGQLLDKQLRAVGIDRAQCLVANVFRLQPPGNKVDHFFISARQAKLSGTEMISSLGQFGSAWLNGNYHSEINALTDILVEYKPKIIVALGRTPLWALTGENGLLAKVGNPLPCRLWREGLVLPTYHPSFILRGNWGLEPQWQHHFRKAQEISFQSK